MTIVTHEQLCAMLHYNPENGVFTWRVSPRPGIQVGDVAGSLTEKGYLRISIKRRPYRAHRLAWFYVHGVWPSQDVDHWNHARADNRIKNLRDIGNALNQQNRGGASANNKLGVLGVSKDKRRSGFRADIRLNKRLHYLGTFSSIEEASAAYQAAKAGMHSAATSPEAA